MKLTGNDIIFAILQACVDGLRSDRLVYYMYAFQQFGLDLRYRYRVKSSGIACRDIATALNTMIAHNKVVCRGGELTLTSEGYLYYDNIVLTLSEWDKLFAVKHLLDSLSEEELFFVCVTDIVVNDMLKRSGVDGLRSGRATIEGIIKNLSLEYSEDNFNTALKVMREIKEGTVVWRNVETAV